MKQIQISFARKCILIGACLCALASLNPKAGAKPADLGQVSAHDGRYKQGDKLYVFAYSGLVLRGQPSPQGAKIMTIPSASIVEVVDASPFRFAHSVKEDCGVVIEGHWVEVSFEGNLGYLFDGYLLKHEPKSRAEVDRFWAGDAKLIYETKSAPPYSGEPWIYHEQIWENGVRETYERGEGGGIQLTFLPKGMFTFADVYLLAISRQLLPSPAREWKCDCAGKKDWVECQHTNGYTTLTIQVDGSGNTIIAETYAD